MAGTRTAPAVNGTPQFTNISIHMIDASGDLRSVSVQAGGGVTNAQIETAVDNIQDYSNASIYKVEVSAVYNSQPQKTSAVEAPRSGSVFDNVVLLYKSTLNRSQNWFIPAPTAELMPDGSDSPDMVVLALIRASFAAVLNGTASLGYVPVSVRYTERREKNQREFF